MTVHEAFLEQDLLDLQNKVEEKDKQECSCGGKLKRVIEWEGIATAEGSGWFGKSDGSKAI